MDRSPKRKKKKKRDEFDYSTNPYYQELRTTFSHFHDHAVDKGYTLCVPHASCIAGGLLLTQDFVEMHILMPSPLQTEEGQFFLSLSNVRVVVVDNCVVIPSQNRRVTILSEELCYSEGDASYTVLLLRGSLVAMGSEGGDPDGMPSLRTRVLQLAKGTHAECFDFISSVDESTTLLRKAANKTSDIKLRTGQTSRRGRRRTTSVSVEDLERAVVEDLRSVCVELSLDLMDAHRALAQELDGDIEDLIPLVESFLHGLLCPRLFPWLRSLYKGRNDVLESRMNDYAGITLQMLGVRRVFYGCTFWDAILELQKLPTLVTPREKLNCLSSVNDAIVRSVGETLADGTRTPNADEVVSADDLLGFFTFVVLWSMVPDLFSHFKHMDTFQLTATLPELEYLLVTLQAVLTVVETGLSISLAGIQDLEGMDNFHVVDPTAEELGDAVGSSITTDSNDFPPILPSTPTASGTSPPVVPDDANLDSPFAGYHPDKKTRRAFNGIAQEIQAFSLKRHRSLTLPSPKLGPVQNTTTREGRPWPGRAANRAKSSTLTAFEMPLC